MATGGGGGGGGDGSDGSDGSDEWRYLVGHWSPEHHRKYCKIDQFVAETVLLASARAECSAPLGSHGVTDASLPRLPGAVVRHIINMLPLSKQYVMNGKGVSLLSSILKQLKNQFMVVDGYRDMNCSLVTKRASHGTGHQQLYCAYHRMHQHYIEHMVSCKCGKYGAKNILFRVFSSYAPPHDYYRTELKMKKERLYRKYKEAITPPGRTDDVYSTRARQDVFEKKDLKNVLEHSQTTPEIIGLCQEVSALSKGICFKPLQEETKLPYPIIATFFLGRNSKKMILFGMHEGPPCDKQVGEAKIFTRSPRHKAQKMY